MIASHLVLLIAVSRRAAARSATPVSRLIRAVRTAAAGVSSAPAVCRGGIGSTSAYTVGRSKSALLAGDQPQQRQPGPVGSARPAAGAALTTDVSTLEVSARKNMGIVR